MLEVDLLTVCVIEPPVVATTAHFVGANYVAAVVVDLAEPAVLIALFRLALKNVTVGEQLAKDTVISTCLAMASALL